jgi:2-polyprenyl-6-methoxyphenol hydroxylase-like FAD-dependent oxidoreductase
MTTIEVPILIAGGASVGLSLAADLGWRGVSCLVVEPRQTVNPHPRANAVGNRTMEYFRRWGVDLKLINKGIPADYPADYHWVSTLHGHRLHLLSLPSQAQLEQARLAGRADPRAEIYWSPYLKTICGQQHVEQALRDYVASRSGIEARYGWELVDFEENEDHVLAEIRCLADGKLVAVKCRYLVGCDGGQSTVRTRLGIDMSGRSGLARFVSIYFRAPGMMKAHGFGHGNIYFPLHKAHRGFLLNWDTGILWTYHKILNEGQEWTDVDPVEAVRGLVGSDIDVEVLELQPWTAHALVADRYSRGRVFMAGDAVHKFTPTGGLGMNTGISDAIDLGWKLAAVVKAWAPPAVLDSYHVERHPIGLRNTAEAADNFDRLFSMMGYGDELDDEGPSGVSLRNEVAAELKTQEKLLASSGVLLGYRYSDSPLIVPDGTEEPPDNPRRYTPVARPGHRLPHLWLSPEVSVLDVLGPDFTLICCGGATEAADVARVAAERLGVPLRIVQAGQPEVRDLYQADFVLVRPDMMVAWRGNTLGDIVATLRRAIGAST